MKLDPTKHATTSAREPPSSATIREPSLLRLRGLSKMFGNLAAVEPLDLDIYPRDFVAVLGPSGCGKTTLLRMIGGFVEPTSGSIEIGGVDVTSLGPERRPTNMVFQGYGLFPHMNVAQNIGYGLRLMKLPKGEIAAHVERAIALVHLGDFANRSIEQLSGGQQQRVALARALVMRPKVLLLDEPLAALDLKLRHAMQDELRRIHHEIGGTFVFVTHDQGEALALANRIAVMQSGRLEQIGSAQEIYAAPKTRFVATFIGEANVLPGRRVRNVVRLAAGLTFRNKGADGDISVVVRPEEIVLLGCGEHADIEVEGTIVETVFLGAHVNFRVVIAGDATILVQAPPPALRRAATGAPVRLGWAREAQRILSS